MSENITSTTYKKFKIAFAVTETGQNVATGDYFTALELGNALSKNFDWEIIWLPKSNWYNVQDANAIVAMTDHYDLNLLNLNTKKIIKICWMRNWFDRWASKSFFKLWDIRLCSSIKAAKHIKKNYGFTSYILRIATNPEQFKPRKEKVIYDFVFTGSYWNSPRDIEHLNPRATGLRFALFGKNWENHPQFTPYLKGFAQYSAMPKIYNQSKLLIDDANSVTKEWGSVNSRVFDALASGIMVITNSATGSAELFQNKLPVYDSPESLYKILHQYINNQKLYTKTFEELRKIVITKHTYDIRSHELAKIILYHLKLSDKMKQHNCIKYYDNQIDITKKFVTIIIPVFNQAKFTDNCLRSIFKNTPNCFEIILVDNGSTDETHSILTKYVKKISIIRNEKNEGFAKACNKGALFATTPLLLFLNNDTEVQPNWLPPLLSLAIKPDVGAVGSKLLFPDGTIQHTGVVIIERKGVNTLLPRHAFLGENPNSTPPDRPTCMQAVTAACFIVKKTDFYDVGGFDTSFWNGSEDIDFCFKLTQLGRKVIYEPKSVVIHHEGKSGHERTVAISSNNIKLRSRWDKLIKPDIIDIDGHIELAEGFSNRMQCGGDYEPDIAYGKSIVDWWKQYRKLSLSTKLNLSCEARIAIHICTPNRNDHGWGDTAFGYDLAKAFFLQGYKADVLFKNEWHLSNHDIVIHIRGLYRFYPNKNSINILWIISHPELISKNELDDYDIILIASEIFLNETLRTTNTPCYYLSQATGIDINSNYVLEEKLYDILFIGNNYTHKKNRRRQIVQDILDTGLGGQLRVIGANWKGSIPSSMILSEYIPQDSLPYYYTRAKINLNDHNVSMAIFGFINNRTFDIATLSQFQISNYVHGIGQYGIITYNNTTDLRHKIEFYLKNECARQEISHINNILCKNEKFNVKVKKILSIINNHV